MDFIERIFGVSPDGGSGLFEWLMLLVAACVVAGVFLRRRARRLRRIRERDRGDVESGPAGERTSRRRESPPTSRVPANP